MLLILQKNMFCFFYYPQNIYLVVKKRVFFNYAIFEKEKKLALEKVEVIINLLPPNKIKDIQEI